MIGENGLAVVETDKDSGSYSRLSHFTRRYALEIENPASNPLRRLNPHQSLPCSNHTSGTCRTKHRTPNAERRGETLRSKTFFKGMSRYRDSKTIMKTFSTQLPARVLKRAPSPSLTRGGPGPNLLLEGIRLFLFDAVQNLRAVFCGLIDDSAYQQVALGREISVVFTTQGPLVYRCRAKHAWDSASAGFPVSNR
jgi:hypothetical protein